MRPISLKRYSILVAALCCMWSLPLLAETREHTEANPHQIRIGIGDNLGSLMHLGLYYGEPPCPEPPIPDDGLPVEWMHNTLSYCNYRLTNEHYMPHLFLEYQYRLRPWLALGVQTDFRANWATREYYNLYGDSYGRRPESDFWMAIIPEVQFSYLHLSWFSLYSSIGIGYAFEVSSQAHHTQYVEHSIALHVTALGLSFGKGCFFGNVELGLLSEPPLEAPLDRFVSASIGWRF